MSKVIVHIDGSSIKGNDNSGVPRIWTHGYGIIICANNETIELSGSRYTPRHLSGSYEFYAFIEMALWLHKAGYDFKGVTVYTDDMEISQANFALHPENYRRTRAMQLLDKFHNTMSAFGYGLESFLIVANALTDCHIVKIKGHSGLIYSERVDYLARSAARKLSDKSDFVPLSFNEWLKQGIVYYSKAGIAKRWFPPFCGAPIEDEELALAA